MGQFDSITPQTEALAPVWEGKYPFVMFNPDDIRILEKNGVPTGNVPFDQQPQGLLNPTGQ